MILRPLLLAVLCLVTVPSAVRAEDKPARILMGLASPDRLIEDLEYIVVDLAGEQEQWEKNVLPNIEVFLIGLQTDRPVRMDQVIDAEAGRRNVFVIPVAKEDLKDFLADNLEPIGIENARNKADKLLYELTGDVVGETSWWLRHAFEYVTISSQKPDVPATIADPKIASDPLFDGDKSFDLAMQLLTTKDDVESRKKAIAKLRSESESNLKEPNEGESQAAFDLRKLLANQQLDTLDEIFVQSSELFFGWITDGAAGKANGTIRLAALEGTKLFEDGSELGTKPSHFAAIPQAEDPVLKGRMTLNMGAAAQKRLAEFAKLTEPAAHEKIDKNEKTTPEQKAARKTVLSTLLQILAKNTSLGVIDAFGEVTKQESGKHVMIAAMRADEGATLKTVAEQLPIANSKWTSKLNVEKIGDIEVHHLVNATPTDVVKDFWGTGDMYIAAGPDTIWMAKGQGSLEVLKTYIEKMKGTPDPAGKERFLTFRMHAKPVLYVNESFWEEVDIDLKKIIQSSGIMPKKKEEKKPVARAGQKDAKGERPADKLKDYKWAEPALAAMEGKADVIDVVFDHTDDKVNGMIDVQPEVLKALGAIIADFAEKNLQ